MDPKKISVAQFRAELKKRGLPIGGTKADFIARLDKDDPSGGWVNEMYIDVPETSLAEAARAEVAQAEAALTEAALTEAALTEAAQAEAALTEAALAEAALTKAALTEAALTDDGVENADDEGNDEERSRSLRIQGRITHSGSGRRCIEASQRNDDLDIAQFENRYRDMQLEFENELLRREIDITRRKNEQLRRSTPPPMEEIPRRENISAMLELVEFFDGTAGMFRRWEQQIRQLCVAYRLDDDRAKLLVGNKLKGKAKSWFQTENTIAMSLDKIMDGFRIMYDHCPLRVTLRKKFEAREWKQSESFADYFHDKVTLAKDVPIEEEDLVDYLVDGIPNDYLQDLARMKEFQKKEEMLRVFEKVSLRSTARNHLRRDPRPTGKNDTKSADSQQGNDKKEEKRAKNDEEKPRSPRCYNCNKLGHLAADCRQPEREKGSCFHCGEMGHLVKDCPVKATTSTQVATVDEAEDQICSISDGVEEEETIFRDIDYEVSYPYNNRKIQLSTLMDTGSKVSFIKESFVPEEAVEIIDRSSRRYHGINHSPLHVLGRVRLNITIDNETKIDLPVLVVPDTTMANPVVLGRDTLKTFGLGLRKLEAQAIYDILNIETNDTRDFISDSLRINAETPHDVQSNLRKLFVLDYLEPERPNAPRVDIELKLTLTDEKPFHFSPRRLSVLEKDKLKKMLDHLLERKIIQPSRSEFASPIILVKKKNGELRLCIDYRVLNKVLHRDNYPLPLIEDQIDALRDKNISVFSI
ncbi:PREDICTED: uncharacterized protein LOC105556813 [Vollenhovia emeryi]|uniref:uncharacterized protein LOC105556813 n=1 Tax=Vollenhovia emeryi TaxID=411798 RepID=UPI0005F4E366|nr:PREDICTED: uncharacterized protein LOC105556813 [Vollenhovia emeryi]